MASSFFKDMAKGSLSRGLEITRKIPKIGTFLSDRFEEVVVRRGKVPPLFRAGASLDPDAKWLDSSPAESASWALITAAALAENASPPRWREPQDALPLTAAEEIQLLDEVEKGVDFSAISLADLRRFVWQTKVDLCRRERVTSPTAHGDEIIIDITGYLDRLMRAHIACDEIIDGLKPYERQGLTFSLNIAEIEHSHNSCAAYWCLLGGTLERRSEQLTRALVDLRTDIKTLLARCGMFGNLSAALKQIRDVVAEDPNSDFNHTKFLLSRQR